MTSNRLWEQVQAGKLASAARATRHPCNTHTPTSPNISRHASKHNSQENQIACDTSACNRIQTILEYTEDRMPLAARAALLACVGVLCFFCVCAFGGLLLWISIASACPNITSICNKRNAPETTILPLEGFTAAPLAYCSGTAAACDRKYLEGCAATTRPVASDSVAFTATQWCANSFRSRIRQRRATNVNFR